MKIRRVAVSLLILALAIVVEVVAHAVWCIAKDLHRLSLWLLSGAARLVKPEAS